VLILGCEKQRKYASEENPAMLDSTDWLVQITEWGKLKQQ
jgi:hypothetical protein